MTKRRAEQTLHQTPKRQCTAATATPPTPTLQNDEIASLSLYFSHQTPEEIATFCTDVVEDNKEAKNLSNNMLRIFKQNPNPQTYNALMGTFSLGKRHILSAITHWSFNVFSPLITRSIRLRLRGLTALLREKKELHAIQESAPFDANISNIIVSYSNNAESTTEEKQSEPVRLLFSA